MPAEPLTTHQLAGFRYDSDSGQRQAMCSCGWRFASSASDEAATRWEQHASSLAAERMGEATEDQTRRRPIG